MADLVTVGSKVTRETWNQLRWLAYMSDSTVSAIVAGYIERGLAGEDLSRYHPPDR